MEWGVYHLKTEIVIVIYHSSSKGGLQNIKRAKHFLRNQWKKMIFLPSIAVAKACIISFRLKRRKSCKHYPKQLNLFENLMSWAWCPVLHGLHSYWQASLRAMNVKTVFYYLLISSMKSLRYACFCKERSSTSRIFNFVRPPILYF